MHHEFIKELYPITYDSLELNKAILRSQKSYVLKTTVEAINAIITPIKIGTKLMFQTAFPKPEKFSPQLDLTAYL